ncbi:MAG: HypC/HybG/HupF family hydrogenase formation chaperone [Nitrososphaerales archaeon]
MCLAVPGLVLSKEGTHAKVDFGGGIIREVNISLVDVKVGQYVIVHAGFAIQVMDEDEAKETLELWRQVFNLDEEEQSV